MSKSHRKSEREKSIISCSSSFSLYYTHRILLIVAVLQAADVEKKLLHSVSQSGIQTGTSIPVLVVVIFRAERELFNVSPSTYVYAEQCLWRNFFPYYVDIEEAVSRSFTHASCLLFSWGLARDQCR